MSPSEKSITPNSLLELCESLLFYSSLEDTYDHLSYDELLKRYLKALNQYNGLFAGKQGCIILLGLLRRMQDLPDSDSAMNQPIDLDITQETKTWEKKQKKTARRRNKKK